MRDDEDLPYGENFHDPTEAAAWAENAGRKRPWRTELFERFARLVERSGHPAPTILELGAGPGFLAAHVLDRCPNVARYTLLDFAAPMLALSAARLAAHLPRVELVQRDFKTPDWPEAVPGPFDFVFSLQAVHELRHKRHAPRLYAQIRPLLAPQGQLAICDHLPELGPTPQHRRLYQSPEEHLATLAEAGFVAPRLVWSAHHMALYEANG